MAAVSIMAYPARESFHSYAPQTHPTYQSPRAQEPRPHVSSPSDIRSYSRHHTTLHQPQHNQPSWSSTPPARDPIAGDSNRPSLPPISNLLNIADQDRSRDDRNRHYDPLRSSDDGYQTRMTASHQDRTPRSPRTVNGYTSSPPQQWFRPIVPPSIPSTQLHERAPTAIAAPPPFRHDSAVDGPRSPSTISTGSSSSISPFIASVTSHSHELKVQRADQSHGSEFSSVTGSLRASPREKPTYPQTSNAIPHAAHFVPIETRPGTMDDVYPQRSMPPSFPPQPPASGGLPSGMVVGASNPWEHHHYISASSQATFPQSQDRYICPTCNKAFSRPSSLKIHSHSHTGEKPFRCPHAGCGKAFSVRSNMKRHERGCHGGMGIPDGSTSPMMEED